MQRSTLPSNLFRRVTSSVVAIAVVFGATATSHAVRLADICRVKGQEENTLQGIGLVVGLAGTGDGDDAATLAALADMMKAMGNARIPEDGANVALVMVTATVPGTGARQGDTVTCRVSSINGGTKSLAGGTLMPTPLLGPLAPQPTVHTAGAMQPGSQRVYAFAQGKIHIGNDKLPTSGTITGGCRLEEDFFNRFTNGQTITLVLDQVHASFQTAQDVAESINQDDQYILGKSDSDELLATAIDQVNIQVRIPNETYVKDPVAFVSMLLNRRILAPQTEARVVINESTGAVVVGNNVEIGPVAVTHRNIRIESTAAGAGRPFVGLGSDLTEVENTRLLQLVDALNAVKVPQEDMIEIIKALKQSGRLYGRLIIE